MSTLDDLRRALDWERELIERLERRQRAAEDAVGEHWMPGSLDGKGDYVFALGEGTPVAYVDFEVNARFIASNNPAVVIRALNALGLILLRHKPELRDGMGVVCSHCGINGPYPCPDLKDIAAGQGLEWE